VSSRIQVRLEEGGGGGSGQNWMEKTGLWPMLHWERQHCKRKTVNVSKNEKKSAQRRRKHCALAVARLSQKISPRSRPLSGGTGRPKFNQLETVTTFTYKPSLVRIDARNFELSW